MQETGISLFRKYSLNLIQIFDTSIHLRLRLSYANLFESN